jgi:hypothetical protein
MTVFKCPHFGNTRPLGASLFDRTTDDKQADKISPRTNGTFGFARHTSRPFAKPKEPFFANAQDDRNKLDIDKLLKNMFNILHHYKPRFLPLTH